MRTVDVWTANRFELASMVKAIEPLVSQGHTVDHSGFGLQQQPGWRPDVGSFVGDPITSLDHTLLRRCHKKSRGRVGGSVI